MIKPDVSVIIATFNSKRTLPLVLDSIMKQSYPRSRIEILLVDGGSNDGTLTLGKKYGCRIIENPQTEPVYGKFLGYINASGKYIMYLDHDEVIENRNDIVTKVQALESDKRVKMVVGSGYKNPRGYPFINDYVNDFGDPFSFFIYNLSRNSYFFISTMKRRYSLVSDNKKYAVFGFSGEENLPPFELVQGGSMLDICFLKKWFPEIEKKYELIPHIFFLICSKYPYLAVIKNSPLIHYSAETIGKYLKKITWRIKNNIYYIETIGRAGFTGREKYQSKWRRYKKYLFLLYAYSIIFPLFDSIYLGIARNKLAYLVHLPLTLYAASMILFHYFLKFINLKPKLRNYDESKIIENK